MELDEIYENFGNIYTSKIVPNLAPFESKRRSIEKKYNRFDFISMVLGVTSTILVFICKFMDDMNYLNKNTDTILTVILLCGFAMSAIFCYIAKDIDRKFRDSVKSEILPIILSLFGEFTVKTPTQQKKNKNILKTSLTEIKKLGFFHQAEKKKDDDTIEGIYKNLEINITETTLEHEEYYGKHSRTIRDFKGLIVKTKLNKNYKGTTLLAAKNNSRSATKGKLEKVELEDVEFNKMYNIFSDNQVEVRYLLNPSFMEKIKDAGEIFKSKYIHFAIVNDLFYMFINSSVNYFEIAKTEKNIYDIQNFRKVCQEFVSIFKLIEHLNLAKKDYP